MSTPRKKKPSSSSTVPTTTIPEASAATDSMTSIPTPTVSTPMVSTNPASATSFTSPPESTSSTPVCQSSFVCGQQNQELKLRVDSLEKRISQIEETSAEKRKFLKKAESLLLVFKVVLIAIPVILFIALAVVQYFFYNDSKLLNIVTGIIGIATVAECIVLPMLWKSIESRLAQVEEQIKDK